MVTVNVALIEQCQCVISQDATTISSTSVGMVDIYICRVDMSRNRWIWVDMYVKGAVVPQGSLVGSSYSTCFSEKDRDQ